MKFSIIQFLIYVVCLVGFSAVALASGDHLGGHEHGHGHDAEAIGEPGVAEQVNRTVQIEMNDEMSFVPDHLAVSQGETVRFLLHNSGQIDHEFVLGTEEELLEHYELMQKHPNMHHEDANQVRVAPSQTAELAWHFTKAGMVDFGCLMPGHYDAGMKGTVSVSVAAMVPERHEADNQGHMEHQH